MKNSKTYLSIIGIHILIGILIYYNESIAKLYFWGAFFYFLFRIVKASDHLRNLEVLKACGYFVGAELLLRMTKGAISYEAAKYLVIFFSIMGIFYNGISGKAYPYFLYILLLFPSVFVASTTLSFDANFRTNIAFVLSGPICLGVAALFCYNKRVTLNEIGDVLLFVLLPIISLTAYIYFYNPSIEDVLKGTASNREASGGFGANQVATALGLGMFVAAVRFFINSPTLLLKLLHAALLMLISYRAIVTFSRGGVITAGIVIFAFLAVYFFRVGTKRKNEIIFLFLAFGTVLALTWIISSNTTQGYIDLRYANKDALGREKSDITTGRGTLFMEELKGFIDHPFLGIGSSRAKDQRIEEEGQGITSHNELSRTLAEHGLLGIVILLILLIKPLDFRTQNKKNYYFYAFLIFWFATVNHSSMRIAAPAYIYALALLNVSYEKKRPIHRELPRAHQE